MSEKDAYWGQTDLTAVLDLGDQMADAADDLLTFGDDSSFTGEAAQRLRKLVNQWDEMRREDG